MAPAWLQRFVLVALFSMGSCSEEPEQFRAIEVEHGGQTRGKSEEQASDVGLDRIKIKTSFIRKHQQTDGATLTMDRGAVDHGATLTMNATTQCEQGQAPRNGACTNCVKGRYSDDGSRCKPCLAGYGNKAAAKAWDYCGRCLPGTMNPTPGSECGNCEYGQFQSAMQATACLDCPAGKYSYEGPVSACTDCPVGTYSSTTAAYECTPCAAGKTTSAAGSRASSDCTASR